MADEIKLKHDKEEVLEATKFLYTFSQDKEYQENMKILVDYITDITNSMLEYKNIAETQSRNIKLFTEKLDKMLPKKPQDHKRKGGR